MRKVLLFILSLFLLTGCAVPQEAMEENEKEDAAAVCSDDGTPKKWPTVWQETLDCGAHTCTFDASVEADDSARYFYYVYRKEFSEAYQQAVKAAFLAAGEDPRGKDAPEDALVEWIHKRLIHLEWGGPEPVWQLENWIVDHGGYTDENGEDEGGHFLTEVHIAEKDAQALADTFLATIGVSGCTIARREKARIIDSPTHKTFCEGWDFYYLPSVPGYIPILFIDLDQHGVLSLPYPENEPPFYLQEIHIMISETGCVSFGFSDPVELERGDLAEPELLDFDSVMRCFKRYFMQGCLDMENDSADYDPTVHRVVLTYALQADEDAVRRGAAGVLRPLWVALYEPEFSKDFASTYICYICIDAITGELVNPI